MSKAVLISIRPWWCLKIAQGKKTIEVRKTKPKLDTPFKAYVYVPKVRPYLVWGDVFRGNWETEFTSLSGYGWDEANRIWDVFNGKVMGEFTCDGLQEITYNNSAHDMPPFYQWLDAPPWALFLPQRACLTDEELAQYLGSAGGYGWHISNLNVYDDPMPLSRFHRPCRTGLYCDSCAMYQTHDLICGNAALQITRPPQSWCYVEELT